MPITLEKRRFTVDGYHRIAEVGIFYQNESVELLEGEIVETTPISSRHAAVVDRLAHLLNRGLEENAIVRVQGPIRSGETSEPQPDLAPRPDFYFYSAGHPGPATIRVAASLPSSQAGHQRDPEPIPAGPLDARGSWQARKAGFQMIRRRGSHMIVRRKKPKMTVSVPDHKELLSAA